MKIEVERDWIHVALIIATYCGMIDLKEEKEFPSDCAALRTEYIKAAKEYTIPYDEDGLMNSEQMYEELDQIAKEIYKNFD